MTRWQKGTLGTLVALIVGASASGGVLAPIAMSVGAFAIALFVFPGFLRQTLDQWRRLTARPNTVFVPWLLLYLSGLVFRVRNGESIQAEPLDGWALFR